MGKDRERWENQKNLGFCLIYILYKWRFVQHAAFDYRRVCLKMRNVMIDRRILGHHFRQTQLD